MNEKAPSSPKPEEEATDQELAEPTVPVSGDFEVTKVTRLDSDTSAQRRRFHEEQDARDKGRSSGMKSDHGGTVYRGVGSETVSEGGKRRRLDRKSLQDQ